MHGCVELMLSAVQSEQSQGQRVSGAGVTEDSCLKSSSTAWGKVWKLLFRFIWVPSTMAILPNICKSQRAIA